MDEATWRDAAIRDLGGKPLDKLVWRPETEVALGPLCSAEVASSRGVPRRGWEVLRPVRGDADGLAAAIQAELHGGADALRLDLSGIRGPRELGVAMRGLDPRAVPVELTGAGGPGAAAALVALWRGLGADDGSPRVDFGLDPIGELGQSGGLLGTPERQLAAAAEVGRWCAQRAPRCRAFGIDASRWHDAGGEVAWCVALGVAGGVEAVRAMEAAEVPLAAAFAQVRLRMAVGGRFLLGAASLRATRRVWARVAELAGVDADLALTAVPASRERTRWAVPTNALRRTAATFGAVVGGADRVEAPDLDGDHGGRVARNLQLVLRDEAHLGAVGDPGGGSYALEALTDQLARAAWSRLQQVEREGGLLAAVRSGLVRQVLREGRAKLEARVLTRQEPIVGVTRFPDPQETAPSSGRDLERPTMVPSGLDPIDRFDDAVALGLKASIPALTEALVGEGLARAPACPAMRLAERWEELRERWSSPVWLAMVGPRAEHGARTAWGAELLAAGGLPCVEGEGAEGYPASGCRVAVISASDARFEEIEPLVRALAGAGAPVWVLGRPGAREAALRAAGARGFLFAGMDVLAALRELHAAADRG